MKNDAHSMGRREYVRLGICTNIKTKGTMIKKREKLLRIIFTFYIFL